MPTQAGKPTEADFLMDMVTLLADMRAILGPTRSAELWKEAAKRRPGPTPGTKRRYPTADQKMLEAYDKVRDGSMSTDDPSDKDAPTEVLARKIAKIMYERWGLQAGPSVQAITKRLTRLIKMQNEKARTRRQALAQALLAPQTNALLRLNATELPKINPSPLSK